MENKKSLISQYLGLSIDLRREFLKKGQNEISEVIRFMISLMGTLGLIAGLGFTAYQYILNYLLFFIGEIVIVGTIIYLGYKTKTTLISYAVDTEGYVNYWVNKATEIRKAMIEKDLFKIENLEKELNESMTDTSTPPKFVGATVVQKYLDNALIYSSIGIFIILVSFIFCF